MNLPRGPQCSGTSSLRLEADAPQGQGESGRYCRQPAAQIEAKDEGKRPAKLKASIGHERRNQQDNGKSGVKSPGQNGASQKGEQGLTANCREHGMKQACLA
jgi:hypothetical protein